MSAEATGRTVVMEEVKTDQIVESDGGASCQLEQSQLQSMKVSLNGGDTTTTATGQRVRPRWITNNVESGCSGLRSVARHQAEQADVKLPTETMKSSANKIDDAKHCGVLRQVNENETIDETRVRRLTLSTGKLSVVGSISTKSTRVSLTHKRRKRFPC